MNGVLNEEAATKRRRGCNCRKSGCLKLYCECFTANIRCTERCQCAGCKNQEHNQEEIAQAIQVIAKRTQKPFRSSLPGLRASRLEPAPEPSSQAHSTMTLVTSPTEEKASVAMANDSIRPVCACVDGNCTTDCPCLRLFGVCSSRCQCKGCLVVQIQSERTKGCSCKKSNCLKLYCECLAAQRMCDHRCNCEGCKNRVETLVEREGAVAAILERNPLAFQPKVASGSSQHLRGCNCRKSGCMKNYCECHQAEVACTSRCACHQCRNTETFVSARKMLVFAGVSPGETNHCVGVGRPTQRKLMKQPSSRGSLKNADALEKLHTPPHSSTQKPTALELLSRSAPVAPSASNRRRHLSLDDVSSTTPMKRPVSYMDHFHTAGESDVRSTSTKRKYRRRCIHKQQPFMERIEDASAPTEQLPSVEDTVTNVYDARNTQGVGEPELTTLCRSLLHTAMVVECADEAKSAVEHDKRDMKLDPRRVDDFNDSEREPLSPTAANLFCEEEYSEDMVEDTNHFFDEAASMANVKDAKTSTHDNKSIIGRQRKEYPNLSAMQERAVLQELSVWLRNMTANVFSTQ